MIHLRSTWVIQGDGGGGGAYKLGTVENGRCRVEHSTSICKVIMSSGFINEIQCPTVYNSSSEGSSHIKLTPICRVSALLKRTEHIRPVTVLSDVCPLVRVKIIVGMRSLLFSEPLLMEKQQCSHR